MGAVSSVHDHFLWTPSESHIEASRQQYPNVDALWMGETMDWPICIELRAGHYRSAVCLIARKANVNARSFIDNATCMDLAVKSGCAMSVYELASLGCKANVGHVLKAALQKNASLLGVL